MPVSDSFMAFVTDQLAGCGEIVTRRMFGGAGIYCGDLFFAILSGDRLYLKVDDRNRGDFETAGKGPFQPYGDDRETMQYYEVPLAVLENADELVRWAHKALAVAAAKRAASRSGRARPKKGRPSARRPTTGTRRPGRSRR
jgi:DNA transformation protein